MLAAAVAQAIFHTAQKPLLARYTATTALYLAPAAAILIALVWLGQVPSPLELIGGAIALAGVVLASRTGQLRIGRLRISWLKTKAARWWCAVRA